MKGLFRRKGLDVWQGRFRIPEDIWRQRDRLAELGARGLGKNQEFAKSTKCRDREDAAVEYLRMLTDWHERLADWRSLLANGPRTLNEMEALQVAALGAARRWNQYKASPLDAPVRSGVVVSRPPHVLSEDTKRHLASMTPEEREASRLEGERNVKRLQEGSRLEQLKELRNVRDGVGYPWRFPEFRSIGIAMAESLRGKETDEDLKAAGIEAVDQWSRFLVNLEGISADQQLRESLEQRALGDLSEPPWVENAAKVQVEKTKSPQAQTDERFTFAAIMKTETERRASGRDAKPFPANTVKKYSKRGEEFAAWRRSQGLKKASAEDASTVTRQEVERWRASMLTLEGETLSNRTINDKVSCIVTIIKWGRRHYRDEGFHPEGNPLEGIEKLGFVETPSHLRTYRLEEAVQVLKAARQETEARRRWLSWICAYTGLRIEEAGQLTVEDFFQVQGRQFFRVSTSGRRSLKTASSERRIPVHLSLIKEGLLTFVQARKSGRLFTSRRIQPLMSEWVRETVKITRPELSPNHGWRHFFEDLCGLANMPDAARDYMTGRASGRSRELYGKSELMLPGLAEAMDKVPDILELASQREPLGNDGQ